MDRRVRGAWLGGAILWVGAASAGVRAAPLSADAVLRKVDEIRNPQMDYTLNSSIVQYQSKQTPRTSTFRVHIKGKDKTFIQQLTPANESNRLILMRERAVWAFFPDVSQPLRIPLQQRLTGDVAIGDIARANFTGDYKPAFAKQAPAEARKYHKLDLKAVADDVTYARVVLWADKATLRPVKAEFYAVSGRLLKTCTFENFKNIGGAVRPSRLVMTDAVRADQKSVINVDGITIAPLPEKYFTKDYMKKLQL